jgi:hypothetical protein
MFLLFFKNESKMREIPRVKLGEILSSSSNKTSNQENFIRPSQEHFSPNKLILNLHYSDKDFHVHLNV